MEKLVLIVLFMISCASNKGGLYQPEDNRIKENTEFIFKKENLSDSLLKRKFSSLCSSEWSKRMGELKQKLSDMPKDKVRAGIWYEIGQCYLVASDINKALYYYDLYLSSGFSSSSTESSIITNLGIFYDSKGLTETAYNNYRDAISKDSENDLARFMLALYYLKSLNSNEAQNLLAQLYQRHSSSRLVLSAYGVTLFLKKDLRALSSKVISKFDEKDSAKQLFELALEHSNKSLPDIQDRMGSIDVDLNFLQDFKQLF